MKIPPTWFPRMHPAPPDPILGQILAAVTSIYGHATANSTLLFNLNAKLEKIMATVADVQAALASSESKEATIIGLLTTEAQLQKDTLAQLQALQASGSTDPAALQTIVDKMTADNANMDAAIASVQPPAPAAA